MKTSNIHVRYDGQTIWLTLERPPLGSIDIVMMRAPFSQER